MAKAESQKKIRQLAIVLSSLDRDASQRILVSLPQDTATSIRRMIGQLGSVPDYERQEAFEALRPILHLSENATRNASANLKRSHRASSDRNEQSPAEQLLAQGYEQHDFADIRPSVQYDDLDLREAASGANRRVDKSRSDDSLIAWYDASCKVWADLLQAERPILIATVLAHAPESIASEILQELPSKIAVSTLAAMPKIGHTELDIYREIAGQLNERLAGALDRSPAGGWGLNRAKTIFESLPSEMRTQWVRQIRELDQDLASEFTEVATGAAEQVAAPELNLVASELAQDQNIRRQIKIAEHTLPKKNEAATYAAGVEGQAEIDTRSDVLIAYDAEDFEALLQLSLPNLARIIRRCEPETVLLALAGATRNWVMKFEKMMDAREVPRLRAKLRSMGDRPLAEIDEAQAKIVQAAAELGLFTVTGNDLLAA